MKILMPSVAAMITGIAINVGFQMSEHGGFSIAAGIIVGMLVALIMEAK